MDARSGPDHFVQRSALFKYSKSLSTVVVVIVVVVVVPAAEGEVTVDLYSVSS